MPDPYGRQQRNLTDELIEGATDGGVRKARPDTSRVVADVTSETREAFVEKEGSINWRPTDGNKRAAVAGLVRGA